MRTIRISLFASLIFSCVACDQATKEIAKQALEKGRLVQFLDGIVRFELVENRGALLSLGSSLSEPVRNGVFLVLVPLGLAALAISRFRSPTFSLPIDAGIALMIGGGLGNLADRFFNQGAVVDFVSLGLGSLRTGIFNVSDVAILAGAFCVFFGIRQHEGEEAEPPSLIT